MSATAIVIFVVSIVLAILLHELGHLLTAKRFGMRADRYFVGFGPTLWSTRRGETEYGLKALPLGGFVRIVGMSPIDERRGPVADELLSPEALQRDRRLAARRSGGDTLEQDNLPVPTWERLSSMLLERGTPREVADHVVRRTRTNLPEHPTAADARQVLHEVLVTEVGTSDRFGDLPYRLFEGDRGRFFHDRPAWQRAIVLVTGPVTHLLIAFVALLTIYLFGQHFVVAPVVDEVLPDSPAQEAGLAEGDRLLGVGDQRTEDYALLRDALRERPGEPTELLVQREADRLLLTVVPRAIEDPVTGEQVGQVGFVPGIEEVTFGAFESVWLAGFGRPDELGSAPGGVVPWIGASVEGLMRVFSPQGLSGLVATAAGQTERGEATPVSLVGAAQVAGQVGEGPMAWVFFLFLIAIVNVFFFVLNLVPLPPFDGGHLAVLAVERVVNLWRLVRGRAQDYSVDPRAVVAVTIPVLAVLATVLIATLWLDITDPIRLG